jgi:hypothetical protein
MHQVIERIDFDAFTFKDIKGDPLYILIKANKKNNLIIVFSQWKRFRMLTTTPLIVEKTLLSK